MFFWGYMVYGLIVIMVAFNTSIEIGKNSTPPVQPEGFFTFLSLSFLFFLMLLLALGAFVIHRSIWVLTGKEIVEATPQALIITKQTFGWKKSKEYPSEKVSRLRTNTQPLSIFLPGRKVKRFPGRAGMIAFDYEGKTFTVGLQISQGEAEQIILALQEVLPKQKAG
jgi:hypothetical protein